MQKHLPPAAVKGFFSSKCSNTDSETEPRHCSFSPQTQPESRDGFLFLFSVPLQASLVRDCVTHTHTDVCVEALLGPATSISCCAGDFHLHLPAQSRSTSTAKAGSGWCQPAGTRSQVWHLLMGIQSRQFPEHARLFRHHFPNFGPSTTHTCETHSKVLLPPAVPETGMTSGLNQWIGILLAVNTAQKWDQLLLMAADPPLVPKGFVASSIQCSDLQPEMQGLISVVTKG